MLAIGMAARQMKRTRRESRLLEASCAGRCNHPLGLFLATTRRSGTAPFTAAVPPASDVGARMSAFMRIASALHRIPDVVRVRR